MKTKRNNEKHVNIVTLGCSKNIVDSEVLASQLNSGQLKVVHDSNDFDARTVVINTCGFIKDAKEESVNTILQYSNAKEQGQIDKLFVMGCLSERYRHVLKDEIVNVDGYFGTNDLPEIVGSLGVEYKENLIGERKTSTPGHYAYIKISEGCNRTCSFCAIPLMRGKHVSKPMDKLIQEAQYLAQNGTRELMLIAQDLSYYGVDIYKQHKLPQLLEQLAHINGIEWIRLHYLYPSQFPTDILPIVNNHPSVCNYLDIPFQHISDKVLMKMRRGVSKEKTYDLIDDFRSKIPNVALRTTLLTGHPGEGEKEFLELLDFVRKIRFERLGVFTYSEEEDTFAAQKLKDEVPEKVKQERANAIMELQQQISLEKNKEKIGQSLKVIIDREEGGYFIGRSEFDSPEVDNEVIIKANNPMQIGSFYKVNITGADDYDLYAEYNKS
jgi:ribosomal protein S12 methylthiotransferase